LARHERTRRFERDWRALTDEQRERFRQAFLRLDADLGKGRFRAGLRVKRVAGTDAILEMTWAPNGRATFQYGESGEKEPHLIWRRIGTHEVFRRP
jgi:hypothetical protein